MIRKFNFTGRRKIPRTHLSFALHTGDDGRAFFEASLTLQGLHLPKEADVFVEAYRGTSHMHFSFGTVGDPAIPERIFLDRIQPGGIPLFRVKIVQDGRIIAAADRIVPRIERDEPKDRLCLLPVEFVDLGELIWRLDLSGDHPVLQVNAGMEGIRETVRTDYAFFGLVYPEVVRQVLRHILITDNYGDEECDPEDWQGNWLRFAEDLPGAGSLPSRSLWTSLQDKEFWIEEAVEAFCRKWCVKDRFCGLDERETR